MEVKPNMSRPCIFGELLFDCFPDSQVLGGAPFNVAWNLRGLGLNPLVITAVGDDALGQRALRMIDDWGIDGSAIQVLQDKPTGRVDIITQNGEPHYQFWDDVAFDHIKLSENLLNSSPPAIFYHGSLALRSEVSRRAFRILVDRVTCPRFVDINLRLPHYDFGLTEGILRNCTHLKLNHDELLLLNSYDKPWPNDQRSRWEVRLQLASELANRYSIKNIWLTAGEEGAAWFAADGSKPYIAASPCVADLVDTVGAGDALTAVILRGLLLGQPVTHILDQAVDFAARVCSLRGAITTDRQFYRLR